MVELGSSHLYEQANMDVKKREGSIIKRISFMQCVIQALILFYTFFMRTKKTLMSLNVLIFFEGFQL